MVEELKEKHQKLLEAEKLKTVQAVNKLAEIMNRKDFAASQKGKKVSQAVVRQKEKECRKLQQELNQERDKYNQMVTKFSKEREELSVVSCQESEADLPDA